MDDDTKHHEAGGEELRGGHLPPRPRILTIGCGGIGGIVTAKLARAGHDVSVVTHNPDIASAVNQDGLHAVWDDSFHTVPLCGGAYASLDGSYTGPPFDLALLAVPPDAAVAAVADNLPFLHGHAPVVCLPNGLIEERLVQTNTLPPERVIGGIVAFGASMLAPGRVQQTSAGGVALGRLPGASAAPHDDRDLDAIAALLEVVGPIQRLENLRGARWSKLAINCAISSLGTIGGDRLGALMRHRYVRRLCLETITEVVQLAALEGITLEKVAGTLDLQWLALDDDERLRAGSPGLLARHTVLLAVGAKYRRLRSSMLRAIERGRTPPVDLLNGEITARAARHDLQVPINAALQQGVHAVARGDAPPHRDTLRRLYDRTRDVLRELEMAA